MCDSNANVMWNINCVIYYIKKLRLFHSNIGYLEMEV